MTKKALAVAIAAVFTAGVPAHGQTATSLSLLPESRVWVDGTSTRDDWTVNAAEVSGSVSLADPASGEIRVQAGRFEVPAAKLQGGRSAIMDRLMHGALKAGEHPTITYQFVSGSTTPAGANRYNIATKGLLTLAGVTKEIDGAVVAERLANGTIRFTGSYPLLMTDYEITPPTAMLGALRTGDRVVVNFELLARP
jgi:polyisoprenoid-binding protein YceI